MTPVRSGGQTRAMGLALADNVAQIGQRFDQTLGGGEMIAILVRHIEHLGGFDFRLDLQDPGMGQHVARAFAGDPRRGSGGRAAAANSVVTNTLPWDSTAVSYMPT